jgi:DNA replication protein DnaC
MTELDFNRSRILNNIPARKLQEALAIINNEASEPSDKMTKLLAINRYAESNIPLEYWTLRMERDFKGDPRLLEKYNNYINDLRKIYSAGTSICLAGNHGCGKSLSGTCILKKAAQKGYSCLYTTLTDVVSALTAGYGEEIKEAKRELSMVDFLFVDEVDQRFFSQSDNAKDLYGRSFETVIRTRLQNKLPTLLATNSPNIKENFISYFKDSLGSLLAKVEIFTVMPGNDFRKENK